MIVQNTTKNCITHPVSEPPSFDQRVSQYVKSALQYVGGGVAYALIAHRGGIEPAIRAGIDIYPVMPDLVYYYAAGISRARDFLLRLPTLEQETLVTPLFEEAVFRFGLQEMLLKRFPTAIIQRVSPSHLWVVDCKAAKVARVLIANTAFTLAHATHPDYGRSNGSMIRFIQAFALGIILSTIQEKTGSTMSAIAFHSGYNVPFAFLRDALGVSLRYLPAIPHTRQS